MPLLIVSIMAGVQASTAEFISRRRQARHQQVTLISLLQANRNTVKAHTGMVVQASTPLPDLPPDSIPACHRDHGATMRRPLAEANLLGQHLTSKHSRCSSSNSSNNTRAGLNSHPRLASHNPPSQHGQHSTRQQPLSPHRRAARCLHSRPGPTRRRRLAGTTQWRCAATSATSTRLAATVAAAAASAAG